MRPRYWLLTTALLPLVAIAAIAAVNWRVDIYGLYHPARGRRLPVLGDERVAKYLLSRRYVPENFNGVLSGASISANWDVSGIRSLRVYNESLKGGNIVEEKSLIEAALERPGIAVAFLLVHPAMTYSHDFHTVDMNPAMERSALGSVSLWEAYKDVLNIRLGRMRRGYDYAGTATYFEQPTEMNTHMKEMWNAPDFVVDPLALQARRDLITMLHKRGVRIVFIVPPTSRDLLRTKGVQLDAYVRRMRAEIGAEDLVIDFLSPEYEPVCDRANFSDGVHLTADGARRVVEYINGGVIRWMSEGRLAVASR